MEKSLENLLNVRVKRLNQSVSGGCVNTTLVYQTEDNKLLFVKQNSKVGVMYFHYYFLIYILYCT